MKKQNFNKRMNRVLALVLACVMIASLGTDVTSVTNVYAAETSESTSEATTIESGSGESATESSEASNSASSSASSDASTTESGSEGTTNSSADASSSASDSSDKSSTDSSADASASSSDSSSEGDSQDSADAAPGATSSEGSTEASTAATTEKSEKDPEQTEKDKTGIISTIKNAIKKAGTPSYASNEDGANNNTNDTAAKSTQYTWDGTSYDPSGNVYSTNLQMDWTLDPQKVKDNNYTYTFTYPAGVVIPDKLINEGSHNLENRSDGTYTFSKNEDGTYSVTITFTNQTEIDSLISGEKDLSVWVKFKGEISGDKGQTDGSIKLIGSDNVEITIKPDQIKYNDDETNYYDIHTEKSGSYSAKDKTITYTVYVSSYKGTPDKIAFEDAIQSATGVTLGQPTSVTVHKYGINRYPRQDGGYNDSFDYPVDQGTVEPENLTISGNKISMTLPKIDKAVETTDDNNIACTRYTRYAITYTYKVSEVTDEQSIVNNKVEVSSKGDIEVKSNDTAKVNINNSYTLSKGGWVDVNNNRIRWEITINTNQVDIAGGRLSDLMLAQIKDAQDITITRGDNVTTNNGAKIEYNTDGSIKDILFEATDGEVNNNKYTIVYYTPLDQTGWGDHKVKNTATFDKGGSAESEVTASTGELEKTVGTVDAPTDGKITIPWTVTLKIPEGTVLKAGTEIRDDSYSDTYNAKEQWMTAAQVEAWAQGITWQDDNGNSKGNYSITGDTVTFKGSDGKTYNYSEISEDSDLKYTVWTVKLSNDVSPVSGATRLVFQYETTADVSGIKTGETYTYKNRVTAAGKTAEKEYKYTNGGLVKTDGENNTETMPVSNEDGTLVWKLKATLASEASKLTITDTLPDGIKLVSIKGEDWLNGISSVTISEDGQLSGSAGDYSVGGTYSGQTVTLNLTVLRDGKLSTSGTYTFVLTCQVDKESIKDYEKGKTYSFNNKAVATADGGSIGSAEQQQNWTEKDVTENIKDLDKTGAWDNKNRTIKYSIAINPKEKDLLANGDLLTLKDVFEYNVYCWAKPSSDSGRDNEKRFNLNAYLLPDTVKLYHAVKNTDGTLAKNEDGTYQTGAELTGWSWSVKIAENVRDAGDYGHYNTSTITSDDIPDETALILEYEYQIETDIEDGYDATTMIVSNAASLSGVDESSKKDNWNISWTDNQTSGGTGGKQYILYKVDKYNNGKTLSGAKFTYEKYVQDANGTWDWTPATGMTDEVSGTDGSIVIKQSGSTMRNTYDTNTVYRLYEIEAPTGYNKPSEEECKANAILFYFKDDTDTTHQLPDEIPSGAVNLSENSHVVFVTNESNTTQITVRKRWKNAAGADITSQKTDGKVSFTLYRKYTLAGSTEDNKTTVSGEVKANYGNGSAILSVNKESVAGSEATLTMTYKNQWDISWLTAPSVTVNGNAITPTESSTTGDETAANPNTRTYVYKFTIAEGANVISGTASTSDSAGWTTSYVIPDAPAKPEVTVPDDEVVGTYDITPGANLDWSWTSGDLPLSGTKNDTQYNYSYYIKETAVDGYDISYDRNDETSGVTGGTITITNKSNGSYNLPKTGGSGTMPWLFGGTFAVVLSLLSGAYVMRRKYM